jgi:DNA repair protein RadC
MTISNWPLADRPREKLLALGAAHLSDTELMAIFFQTGIQGKTALDLARELLQELGHLKKILHLDPNTYQKKGVGKAKLAMLKAAIELGRRTYEEPLLKGEVLTSSVFTKKFLASRLQHYPHEVVACIFLTQQLEVLAFEELFRGQLSETTVYPREVVKRCLAHNAANIILAHNHPSGCITPSQSDQETTAILKETLQRVDVRLIDHIIIGASAHFSFAENGLI